MAPTAVAVGPAYLSGPDHGFLTEYSIVGTAAPVGVGASLAARKDRSGSVTVRALAISLSRKVQHFP